LVAGFRGSSAAFWSRNEELGWEHLTAYYRITFLAPLELYSERDAENSPFVAVKRPSIVPAWPILPGAPVLGAHGYVQGMWLGRRKGSPVFVKSRAVSEFLSENGYSHARTFIY
jgi:hypothetical protein